VKNASVYAVTSPIFSPVAELPVRISTQLPDARLMAIDDRLTVELLDAARAVFRDACAAARPPSELRCVPRNSSRTRRSQLT